MYVAHVHDEALMKMRSYTRIVGADLAEVNGIWTIPAANSQKKTQAEAGALRVHIF